MFSFLSQFKEKLGIGGEYVPGSTPEKNYNGCISLGVLMWVVAEADRKFLSSEKEAMEEFLAEKCHIPQTDIPVVMKSVEVAASERIDLYSFTKEASEGLDRPQKIRIVEDLFRLACVDLDLAHEEHEIIRKIADLFHLDHEEFIAAKIKVKKEFGLETIDE